MFYKIASRQPSGLARPAPMGFRLPSTLSGCKPRREATGRALGKRNDLGKKSQQLADVRARRLTPQSTAPTYLPTESVRDNASSEAEGIKGSTFFYILRTSTKPDFSTSRRGIRLILFIGATRPIAGLERSAVSGAPSQYLGPLWLPASFTLNAFAQICAKVRKWGFRNVSRVRVRARSDEPFPQQLHHLHDVQTHCATTPAPFGAIAKTSTNCTRKT